MRTTMIMIASAAVLAQANITTTSNNTETMKHTAIALGEVQKITEAAAPVLSQWLSNRQSQQDEQDTTQDTQEEERIPKRKSIRRPVESIPQVTENFAPPVPKTRDQNYYSNDDQSYNQPIGSARHKEKVSDEDQNYYADEHTQSHPKATVPVKQKWVKVATSGAASMLMFPVLVFIPLVVL